jgi:hypothetical protein
MFKQPFCLLVDGARRHLAYFDHLREDVGYASVIVSAPEALLSYHTGERFFRAFWWPRISLFRSLLQNLFLGRLQRAQPKAARQHSKLQDLWQESTNPPVFQRV